MTEVFTAVLESRSSAGEEPPPIAPPRRKRKTLRLTSETSNKLNPECSQDETRAGGVVLTPPRTKSSVSSTSEPSQRRRPSATSTRGSDSGKSPSPSKGSAFIGQPGKLIMKPSSPRVENYYSGSAMRRNSVPCNAATDKSTPSARSSSLSPADVVREKSATPSPSEAAAENQSSKKATPPPRPSAAPSRPTRLPSKTAQFHAAPNAKKSLIVIDSKSNDVKQQNTVTNPYGKIGDHESQTAQNGHVDDASKVYGKRTQAALNTLVATVKMFNKGTSGGGSSSQKGTLTRKTNKSKTPPKRPPPAVRNTPRPPIQKPTADFDESLYVNQYEDLLTTVRIYSVTQRTAGVDWRREEERKIPTSS